MGVTQGKRGRFVLRVREVINPVCESNDPSVLVYCITVIFILGAPLCSFANVISIVSIIVVCATFLVMVLQ